MTRAASPGCCRCCAGREPTTRPVPWPPGPPPRPASITRAASHSCCRRCRRWTRPGPTTRRTLLDRDPAAQASLDDPGGVTWLLQALRGAGADDAARTLAARAAAQASLDNPGGVAQLLQALQALDPAGADDAARTLLDRDPAAQASLDDPGGVTWLLQALRGAGADDAARTLAARAAAQASLDNPGGVGALLQALAEAGAAAAARTLAARAAAQASLDNPGGVAQLLQALQALDPAGADDAARTLLDRDPAAQASLDDPGGVGALLQALAEAGAAAAARTLADRAANAGMFDLFLELRPDKAPNYLLGREPDGTPSQPWKWEEPGQLGPRSAEATLPLVDCRLPNSQTNSGQHPVRMSRATLRSPRQRPAPCNLRLDRTQRI